MTNAYYIYQNQTKTKKLNKNSENDAEKCLNVLNAKWVYFICNAYISKLLFDLKMSVFR